MPALALSFLGLLYYNQLRKNMPDEHSDRYCNILRYQLPIFRINLWDKIRQTFCCNAPLQHVRTASLQNVAMYMYGVRP